MAIKDRKGQGTVEAALVIPIVFILVLLLIQPAIVLYDRIIMTNAAAEGCRLNATLAAGNQGCKEFIHNRLASIPPHALFHVHEPECSWDVAVTGDETTEISKVVIANKVRPLPLFGSVLGVMGLIDRSGLLTIEVSCEAQNQPSWVTESVSGDPNAWVREW